jgi:hypothetical protein
VRVFCKRFVAFWNDERRRRTVARAAVHERQFEGWWKIELAAHLWETAAELDCYVFVEAHDRADLVLGEKGASTRAIVPHGKVCVPIELKTSGTFWNDPRKAFCEPGKKRLWDDMNDAREMRRTAEPFPVVALLLTHKGHENDARYERFKAAARELGRERGLLQVLDEAVPLPDPGHDAGPAHAWQMVWIAPNAVAGVEA